MKKGVNLSLIISLIFILFLMVLLSFYASVNSQTNDPDTPKVKPILDVAADNNVIP